jgi:hypothetical protein
MSGPRGQDAVLAISEIRQGRIPTPAEFRALGPAWEEGWRAGATAEAVGRNEGLSKAARELRDCLESLAQLPAWRERNRAELIGAMFRIFTAGQPWWQRLRLAGLWGREP